ncbi:Tyrosine-protein kinase receptor svh-2 [Caenorhabditis elegans]|uniref:Isoform b of Tyrosine-protein kinase receptor svh-2 n=1 Tax=Caenorhabditis elegans TaxID=6239 RepID=H2KZU7-2|nr:Tyrosine-protein kinase receptor svh-2 [Caenorhabditis elegans]BAL45942.1 c-Met/RON-like tyrosine kinase [Caenorhabditis elegans]CCD83401.1 Tyrosine-protein kinase receptor svh-2 [Caenorhabditis elegans]|eukprot:NP_509105.1 Tyrosine-protein kinase receptor svh-2 [Caenorhabditis elegans]
MVLGSSQSSAKELTTQSSIFRFLVLLLCFTSATGGQINGKLLNGNGVFVSRDELQNKNVLGVITGFDLLVVATHSRFQVFENNEERRTVGHVSLDMHPRTKFLELKLFSKSEIFYCDESSCGLCTYSGVTSSCSTFMLNGDEPKIQEILSSSAVKIENLGQIMLAISFKNEEDPDNPRTMILRYNAQDTGTVIPTAYHADSSFIHNNHALTGFEREGFVYFVMTASQIFEPEVFLHDQSNNKVTVTKVIRFCATDQTADLASKISILVGCDQEFRNISSRGETAVYDHANDLINIVMFNHTSMNHLMCRFKMANIEKRFKTIWSTCQETSFSGSTAKTTRCKYPQIFDQMKVKKGCLTYSRLDDESSPTLCVRYGRGDALDNCQLHTAKSNSYRYGWLEDYNVLQGELMMRIPYPFFGIAESLITDGKSYFAAVSGEFDMSDVLRFSASESADIRPHWRTNISVVGKFSITKTKENQLLYTTVEGLQSLDISCKGLYPNCQTLRQGGWEDPLECSWCADDNAQRTITSSEVSSCKNNLKHECPPSMRWIHKYNNNSGFTAVVDGFRALKNPKLNACGTNCVVTVVDSSSIQCDTNPDEVIGDSCKQVFLSGMIGDKNYSFPFDYQQADRGTQTDVKNSQVDDKKGSSPGWKIAIAIISVMTIILIVAIIVYYMRNRFPRIKTHVRPPIGQRIENEYDMGHMAGRQAQLAINGDNYVKVFRSMRPDLKVDFKNLRVDKLDPIGQGHYGVVYKAMYSPSKSLEEKVVCKYLKEGKISEFYEEARTMSEFDHPNILKLIGVALDDSSHLPIIITEYMAKGDLKSFIENVENTIKMRDLFEFAFDIAKGMNYMHSKKFIHRDLACRNCLLDEHLRVKIADFGLCRKVDIETELYVQMHERDLPVRWFPPEISEQGFGITSDIWSFGVVIWELFTRGSTPYSNMASWILILPWLKESETNRLRKPPYCPEKLYTDVMLACWKANPAERPQFSDLVTIIPNVVKYMEGYDRSQLQAGYERVSELVTSRPSISNLSE